MRQGLRSNRDSKNRVSAARTTHQLGLDHRHFSVCSPLHAGDTPVSRTSVIRRICAKRGGRWRWFDHSRFSELPIMTYQKNRTFRSASLCGSLLFLIVVLCQPANAQQALPPVVVQAPKHIAIAPKKPPARRQSVASRSRASRIGTTAPSQPAAPLSPAAQLAAKGQSFDQARSNLFTTTGTTSDTITHDTIQDLPQGTNAPVEKVLLQAPGVS